MSFSHHHYLVVFHWSLDDSKSPLVSRTLLRILADRNNAVVCMVLILPLISNSSCLFCKSLGTVPCIPTTTGITVTFMFYSFLLLWQGPSICLFFRFLYYHLLIRVFHISVSWWSFTRVWVTASLLVSRTLLSILAVLNNVVVLMVSTRLPTSKSSSPFSNPLVTVPNAPITIGLIVTFMFHSFSVL